MTSSKKHLLQFLVFLGFFPYPAVGHIGNTAGIQMVDVLVLLVILFTLPEVLRAKSTLAYVILVMPIFVSLGALAFFGWTGNVDLGIRVTVGATFSLLILAAGGSLMRHARVESLITPVSMAMCIHAFVGVWQYRAFSQGTFPLRWIFQNPSFFNFQDIAADYALYVARPFGLFPEPSAMAAALGPWVLFLLWYGLKPGAKGCTKALVGAAAGTLLILLSQTIYAVFLFPCGFLILVLHRRTVRRFSILELVAWSLAGLGAVLFPILSAGRIGVTTNESTLGRASSLIEGMAEPFNNGLTLLVGIGPGQSAQALAAQNSSEPGIYSVVVSAFAEGGLIALVGMICVWIMCLHEGPAGYRRVFLLGWVAGIAFATGYTTLGPVWLFLAMMLDLEFESENSPRDTNFGIGRSGATLVVSGDGPEQRASL